jgi:hypothetical protein
MLYSTVGRLVAHHLALLAARPPGPRSAGWLTTAYHSDQRHGPRDTQARGSKPTASRRRRGSYRVDDY